MTYISQIRKLLNACDCRPTIYDRQPTRETCEFRPLTEEERSQVEAVSRERGWRMFRADRMSNL